MITQIAKFTPGPWKFVVDDEWNQAEIAAPSRAGKVEIATLGIGYTGEVGAEQDANIHLICAAPQLYAACRQAAELFEDDEGISAVLRAALESATGGSCVS